MHIPETHIIRDVQTGKMVDNGCIGAAFEGQDGKARASELVDIHNKLYPNNLWKVSHEVI